MVQREREREGCLATERSGAHHEVGGGDKVARDDKATRHPYLPAHLQHIGHQDVAFFLGIYVFLIRLRHVQFISLSYSSLSLLFLSHTFSFSFISFILIYFLLIYILLSSYPFFCIHFSLLISPSYHPFSSNSLGTFLLFVFFPHSSLLFSFLLHSFLVF